MQIEELYQLYLKSMGVSTDTRRIDKGQLFFALKGDRFNGNKWAQLALDGGADHAIIDEGEYHNDERMILVDDVLSALQQLAHHHRLQYRNPVIGLTGSNGKTTTKELIHLILSEEYEVNTTEGNYNNHIGLPLTLLKGGLEQDFWLVEMGTNAPGEIAMLSELAKPDFGLITNIGAAHLEKLIDLDGVFQEKTSLFRSVLVNSGSIFVNRGDDYLKTYNTAKSESYVDYEDELCGYGKLTLKKSKPYLSFELIDEQGRLHAFTSNLVGRYNQVNVSAALTVGASFNVPIDKAINAISSYAPDNMRSQLKRTARNLLILDSYNANPTSMKASIQSFVESEYEAPLCIVGDMLESGAEGLIQHKEIEDLLIKYNVPHYLVGETFSTVSDQAFDNVEALKNHLAGQKPIKGRSILLKASRGIELERLLDLF